MISNESCAACFRSDRALAFHCMTIRLERSVVTGVSPHTVPSAATILPSLFFPQLHFCLSLALPPFIFSSSSVSIFLSAILCSLLSYLSCPTFLGRKWSRLICFTSRFTPVRLHVIIRPSYYFKHKYIHISCSELTFICQSRS